MITNVQDNSRVQFNVTYSGETGFKSSPSKEPMTVNETIKFLNQLTGKIAHPVLESTLYDARLEERIL